MHPLDDAFYVPSPETPAFVLERLDRWKVRPPEFTLAEVVAGKPWEKQA